MKSISSGFVALLLLALAVFPAGLSTGLASSDEGLYRPSTTSLNSGVAAQTYGGTWVLTGTQDSTDKNQETRCYFNFVISPSGNGVSTSWNWDDSCAVSGPCPQCCRSTVNGLANWTEPPAALVPGSKLNLALSARLEDHRTCGYKNIGLSLCFSIGGGSCYGYVQAKLSDNSAGVDQGTVEWPVPNGSKGNTLLLQFKSTTMPGTYVKNYTYTYQPALPTPTPTPPCEDSAARFSDLAGQVEVRHDWDEEGWTYAKLDTVLCVGDHIRTADGSVAILSFTDASTFQLKPESEIVLSSPAAKDSHLKLLAGHLWANVKKMMKDGSMVVEMSQAVAGIKGTTFVVQEKSGTSTLKVLDGTVTLTSRRNGKQATVSSGQMMEATSAGLGSAKAFDVAAEQASWANLIASVPTSRTFPETGHTVKGRFLQYWNQHGGLAQQGYPISEEMQEKSDTDGKVYTVQYFERAVFELHPENKAPNDVLLSLLGVFFYQKKYPGAGGAPNQNNSQPAGATYFPETGKWVAGGFLEYWKKHGGLAQQGYPISNEFQEKSATDGKTYTVQYFQRAVFEYHPEYKGTANEVLLSLLGSFRYKEKH